MLIALLLLGNKTMSMCTYFYMSGNVYMFALFQGTIYLAN